MDLSTTIYIVVDVFIAFLILSGNMLVCYVVLHSRALRRKAMYLFVTSLAFADIFVGMTAIPFGILTKLGLPRDSPNLCILMLSLIVISTQVSIFNMTGIAIERYLAIRHPRIHYSKLTCKRSVHVIILTWFLSVCVGALPLLGWNRLKTALHHSEDLSFPSGNRSNAGTENVILDPGNIGNFSNVSVEAKSRVDDGTATACKFVQIMDLNYMFFNFTACVLPPLIICAILYFTIFLSLSKSSLTNAGTPLYTQAISKESIFSKSPCLVIRRKRHASSTKIDCNNPDTQATRNDHRKNKSGTSPENNDLKTAETQKGNFQLKGRGESTLLRDSLNNLLSTKMLNNRDDGSPCKTKISTEMRSEYNVSDSSLCVQKGSAAPKLNRKYIGMSLEVKSRYNRRKRESRAAAVLGLIVLTFVACWMPIHILNTIIRFDTGKTVYIPEAMVDVAVLLTHANSAVNFFLYSWRLKSFRDQLHRTVLHRFATSVKWSEA